MAARKQTATLSGPGIDQGYDSPAVALSAAISRATRAGREVTLYVRDSDEPYGRVENDGHGRILVYRTAT